MSQRELSYIRSLRAPLQILHECRYCILRTKKNSSDPKSSLVPKVLKSKNTQNMVYCENNLNLSGIIPTVMLPTSFRNNSPHLTMQGDLLEVRDKLHGGKALSEGKCTGCIMFQSTYVSQSHRWRLK